MKIITVNTRERGAIVPIGARLVNDNVDADLATEANTRTPVECARVLGLALAHGISADLALMRPDGTTIDVIKSNTSINTGGAIVAHGRVGSPNLL